MSVESNSLTIFVLDISAPMGQKREVEDRIVTENLSIQKRKRTTTDLEWVCEFVSARIAETILRGLKTTRIGIITYGSPRTNNVVNDSGIADQYLGIDEIFCPAVPDLDTLDLIQSLRAVAEDEDAPPADPLAALVDAVQLSSMPAKGGIKDSQRNTWKRSIYLITDGRSQFSFDGADAIRDKLVADNINLRLLGIDFDDPEHGVKLEGKSKVKQNNEKFWQTLLAQIPTAGFATATSAVEQSRMPNLQVTRPSPSKTVLSFGDPKDLGEKQALQIPIALYKMTDVARPMTQSKISKLARESAQASRQKEDEERRRNQYVPSSAPLIPKGEHSESGGPGSDADIVYKVDVKREYFLLDQIAAMENNQKDPEPLPSDSDSQFMRAWKLGASLIPVPEESFGKMDTHKSIEILHFFAAKAYRREYNMDQIWYVFADHAQVKAQVQLSTFVRAMVEMDVLAVVRCVRKDEGEPEIGILKPVVDQHNEYFFYSKAPFREDLRQFLFPPLDRIVTTEGIEMRQGPTIPTAKDQEAMDAFVDSLDLDKDWFNVFENFNPAIHSLKSAVRHRFIHPDDKSLPGPHPDLVKYLEAPQEVQAKAAKAAETCRQLFKIAYVPPKGNADRKKRNFAAMGDDRRRDRDEAQAEAAAKKLAKYEIVGGPSSTTTSAPQNGAVAAMQEDSDATEDEEESLSAGKVKDESQQAASSPSKQAALLDVTKPVEQFVQMIETDDVTKATVQMHDTIIHLVETREYSKAADCMRAAKKAAQEYEEAMRWNTFVRNLKRGLLKNHKTFWDESIRGHPEFGLITEKEDEAGQSDVTAEDAKEFIETEDI